MKGQKQKSFLPMHQNAPSVSSRGECFYSRHSVRGSLPRRQAGALQMSKGADATSAISRSASLVLLAFFMLAFFVFLYCPSPMSAEDSAEEEIDEKAVGEVQEDIKDVEKDIKEEEKEKEKLEQELYQIQTSVNITQYEISKTESHIEETEETISRKEGEISEMSKKIDLQKQVLASLVRETYYNQSSSMVVTMVNEGNVSQFLGEADRISSFEEKILSLIEEIKATKDKIESEKGELEEKKEEKEGLLKLKEDQQQTLLGEKYETQSDISEKAASIGELQAKLSKLKSNLSSLLGKSYDADDIEEAASFASKATGVRKDFIMGMLVVESDLGRYTGGCDYKESRMSDYRKEIFKDICEELDYDYKKKKVSCPPSGYSGTGGAMGVAQFMPDTWLGYKSSIASLTGHDPPDPWSLTDGVVGMALKLARGGATSKSGECNAAKLYLSGTTSSAYNWYCDRVKYWADNYERLLD